MLCNCSPCPQYIPWIKMLAGPQQILWNQSVPVRDAPRAWPSRNFLTHISTEFRFAWRFRRHGGVNLWNQVPRSLANQERDILCVYLATRHVTDSFQNWLHCSYQIYAFKKIDKPWKASFKNLSACQMTRNKFVGCPKEKEDFDQQISSKIWEYHDPRVCLLRTTLNAILLHSLGWSASLMW